MFDQSHLIEPLLRALKPFAERAKYLDETTDDEITHWHPAIGSPVSAGDLRRAKEIYEKESPLRAEEYYS